MSYPPANVRPVTVALGVPCRVARPITDLDLIDRAAPGEADAPA